MKQTYAKTIQIKISHLQKFLITLTLISYIFTFDCKFEQGCNSCDLHREQCETGKCHRGYYWDSSVTSCTLATSLITNCWIYTYDSSVVKCEFCEIGYWRSFDSLTCTKTDTTIACGNNCGTCYQTTDGTAITADGTNSSCDLCDYNSVEEEGRYVNVKATTSTCEAYTTNNSALVYTEVPKCKYMKGGSDECFLCEDKYSFSWNTNNKECTSNDGKLQICWKFSNEIGSGCDKCYIGYIMINEITCKAASNLMIGMGLVSLIVMIMNLINF